MQFRCSRCGELSIVEVTRRPDQTQVITPLPSFARGEGGIGPPTDFASEYQDLELPAGKELTLSVIAGPATGLVYPISKPRVVLGRAGADIEIDDPEVSRAHCALEIKGEAVRLRDLESTNGTYLNDERIRAAELKHFSEFRIGSSIVRLTITSKPAW